MVQPFQLALPAPLPVSAGPSVPLCGSMTEPHSLQHLLSLEAWTPWLWDCRAASPHGLAMLLFQAVLINPEQSDSLVSSRIPHSYHPLVGIVVHQVSVTHRNQRLTSDDGPGPFAQPFPERPIRVGFLSSQQRWCSSTIVSAMKGDQTEAGHQLFSISW